MGLGRSAAQQWSGPAMVKCLWVFLRLGRDEILDPYWTLSTVCKIQYHGHMGIAPHPSTTWFNSRTTIVLGHDDH